MKSNEATPKKINITVNGVPREVEAGKSIIEVLDKTDVFVPRYCYHVDLSIAGVCRMCVVEVEKNPKLQIACNTPVAEGMVIHTDSPKVKEAVKSALELHLINHPLDCPICDKAGECKLQDYYQGFGLYQSRMEFDAKGHKPKVVDIGTIVLDSERCILCTRCVRFTSEVTKSHEFGIFNRGDRSELRTYDKGPLRNDYTGNLADICPVGALTAKDFRFQMRVWFLEKSDSVCGLCARGCNTVVSMNPKLKKLYRVEPRRNPEVNSSWICDTGRWGYHYVYDENRIKVPKKRNPAGSSDNLWSDQTWDYAFQVLSEQIQKGPKKTLVGLSTQMTNEEIVDAITTLKELGVENFFSVVDEKVVNEKTPFDGVLKHKDQTPNAAGYQWVTEAMKVSTMSLTQATQAVSKSQYDTVILLGLERHPIPWVTDFIKAVPSTSTLIVHSTSNTALWDKAAWILPNTSFYEKTGTVVNALNRLQKTTAALPAQHTSRDVHGVVFGIRNGNDRTLLPSGRPQALFESVMVEKMLAIRGQKWRGFTTTGIPLKERAENATA